MKKVFDGKLQVEFDHQSGNNPTFYVDTGVGVKPVDLDLDEIPKRWVGEKVRYSTDSIKYDRSVETYRKLELR